MIVTGMPPVDLALNGLASVLRWSLSLLAVSLMAAAVIFCFADLGGDYGDNGH